MHFVSIFFINISPLSSCGRRVTVQLRTSPVSATLQELQAAEVFIHDKCILGKETCRGLSFAKSNIADFIKHKCSLCSVLRSDFEFTLGHLATPCHRRSGCMEPNLPHCHRWPFTIHECTSYSSLILLYLATLLTIKSWNRNSFCHRWLDYTTTCTWLPDCFKGREGSVPEKLLFTTLCWNL